MVYEIVDLVDEGERISFLVWAFQQTHELHVYPLERVKSLIPPAQVRFALPSSPPLLSFPPTSFARVMWCRHIKDNTLGDNTGVTGGNAL